jgi:drug/metabolite transporter (DMT)-like permease
MPAALLTCFFFALSAILARRSIAHVGSQRANFARQLVALFLLGLWAHTWGEGIHGATFGILFLSGVVGFGMGDWALFEALPRLGSGLTVLLAQCLAAPIAAITEWLWLGTGMTGVQMGSSALILLGVALALAPGKGDVIPAGHRLAGLGFGLVAATGQAWGAVLSRYAFQEAQARGFMLDGITAAYQRLWGGALSIGLLLLLGGVHSRWRQLPAETEPPRRDWRRAWPWIAANALVGATLGVSCYQWALKAAPSSVVLPIVATTPLVVMFLAFVLEGVRPTRRAMAGAVVAVVGVVVLVRNA